MNFEPLTHFLNSLEAEVATPGLSCMVSYRHKPVYEHHTGHCDAEGLRTPDADTLYNVYSVSKMFTCTAAMQLLAQGRFLLYEPIWKYLPEFRHMKYKNEQGEVTDLLGDITIENLFTMTSGLNYDLNNPLILAVKEKTNGRCPTRETVAALADQVLDFRPGTRWQYSLSHDVLAALIEVVSGMRLGEYMKKNIFDPLGMKDTGYHRTPDKEARMAAQYHYDGIHHKADPIPLDNEFKFGTEYESGGAGIISSVSDLMLFGEGLNSGALLSRRTMDMLRTNRLSPELLARDFTWTQHTGYGYGLGMATMIDCTKGSSIGSLGEFTWHGAAGSNVWVDPDEEVTIAYTQHVLYSDMPYYMPKLRNLVYHCLGY